MTEYTGPEQLRRRVEAHLPHVTTITAVYEPGSRYQTYMVRFREPLGGQEAGVLQTVMDAYDGMQQVAYNLGVEDRRELSVTFIGGDAPLEGVAWLHEIFQPYVAYTVMLEIRQEGNHLTGRLVFLNLPNSDDLTAIQEVLTGLRIVSGVEHVGGTATLKIHFRSGTAVEAITPAINGTTALSRRLGVCLVDMRRVPRT